MAKLLHSSITLTRIAEVVGQMEEGDELALRTVFCAGCGVSQDIENPMIHCCDKRRLLDMKTAIETVVAAMKARM